MVSATWMKWLLSASLAAVLSPPPAAAQALDFETFKTRVEPIFLEKRPGHARCYACHVHANTAFRLEKLATGRTSWSEEQSRRNFETAQRLVVPGNPEASHLLLHPLAPEAGGEPFHSGGRQFKSKDDPDWQALADWVRRLPSK
jgi:hypothetical protein